MRHNQAMGSPPTASTSPLGRALRTERTMTRVRWVAAVFAVVQVVTYYIPYPPGVLAMAAAVVVLLVVGNLLATSVLRKTTTLAAARKLQVATLVLDAVIVLGLVVVYTFDADTAIWAVIYILPLEGAIKFGLSGSLATMGAAAVAYTAREFYGLSAYGNSLLPTSISFRMGIGFIIAWVAGAMASSLIRDRDQLERAKVAVERSAADLALAVDQLREATAVKDDFLAVTNHELRTPLTTILGYATTLEERWDDLPDSKRRQFIGHISRQGRRLRSLVEDLLTLSSAQAGALEISLRPVPVCLAVDEALAQNGLAAKNVINDCPPSVHVAADLERLTQVLTNFISNAQKYGAAPVSISVATFDGWVEISVCDSGAGVPESFVPHLFEKFSQASRGVSRTAEGTGLGLAIVKELTEAQEGEVWYEPNEPTGSKFCVRLRQAAAPPDAADAAPGAASA